MKLLARFRQWQAARRERRIERLTAKAADLKEDQQYDLLFLHERGFVRATASGQSITMLGIHAQFNANLERREQYAPLQLLLATFLATWLVSCSKEQSPPAQQSSPAADAKRNPEVVLPVNIQIVSFNSANGNFTLLKKSGPFCGAVLVVTTSQDSTSLDLSSETTFVILKNKSRIPLYCIQPMKHEEEALFFDNSSSAFNVPRPFGGSTMRTMSGNSSLTMYAYVTEKIGKFSGAGQGDFPYPLIEIDPKGVAHYRLKKGESVKVALLFEAQFEDVDGLSIMGKMFQVKNLLNVK